MGLTWHHLALGDLVCDLLECDDLLVSLLEALLPPLLCRLPLKCGELLVCSGVAQLHQEKELGMATIQLTVRSQAL